MFTSGRQSSPSIQNKMRFCRTSNTRLMLGTSSSAFEGIFKEHFTILLARLEQNSAIINLVSALRILFLELSWNVLRMDLSRFGGELVKSNPLTLLCH